MRYFLGQFEKSSDAWKPAEGLRGLIDLRGCRGNGFYIGASERTVKGTDELTGSGSHISELVLSDRALKIWSATIGAATGNTLADVLWHALTIHSDHTGALVHPLVPTKSRRLELWLCGQLVKSEPWALADWAHWERVQSLLKANHTAILKHHGEKILGKVLTLACRKYRVHPSAILPDGVSVELIQPTTNYADAFTDTDGTDIEDHTPTGGGFSWVNNGSQVTIQSNQAAAGQNAGDASCRGGILSSDDHEATVTIPADDGGAAYNGPAVRYAAGAATFYYACTPQTMIRQFRKVVAGTQTFLANADPTAPLTAPYTTRLAIDGSTLTVSLANGTDDHSITDTAITGNLYTGFIISNNAASAASQRSVDLYSATDNADMPPGVPDTITINSTGTGLVMAFGSSQTGLTSGNYAIASNSTLPITIASISGSGTTWTLRPSRIIDTDEVVTITPTGESTIPTTNDSVRTFEQAQYNYLRIGGFFHEWGPALTDGYLASAFNPSQFSPSQWIATIKAFNAKYAYYTVKHHNGFCFFLNAGTTYGVVSSPFSGDPFAQFCSVCVANGVKPGAYYSIWDKSFEAMTPGWTLQDLIDFSTDQIEVLMTNYGPQIGLWVDGIWHFSGPDQATLTTAIFAAVHGIQPDCLVIINNHEGTLTNSQIVTLEEGQDSIPASNNTLVSEYLATSRVQDLPLYYSFADYPLVWVPPGNKAPKDPADLASQLNTVVARWCNYVINFGIGVNGLIPNETRDVGYAVGGQSPPSDASASGSFSGMAGFKGFKGFN